MKKNIPPNVINAQHKFPNKRFEMPKGFSKNAIELWKDCEPYAWKTGLLNEKTLPNFIDMCNLHDEYIQIMLRINKEGEVLKTASGKQKINPLFNQERKISSKLSRYNKQFGMTPMSMAKKGLPSPEDLGLE